VIWDRIWHQVLLAPISVIGHGKPLSWREAFASAMTAMSAITRDSGDPAILAILATFLCLHGERVLLCRRFLYQPGH